MFSHDDLNALLTREEGLCVSIYLETARRGPETRRNPIELKNALREADQRLEDRGIGASQRKAILEPLESWQRDTGLHQHLDQGMAIFLAPDFATYLLSPEAFDFHVEVGDAFFIRPLLPLLARDRQFLLLSLDREAVHLFQGDRNGLREWAGDLPESWKKIRGMTDYQKQTGFHPTGPTPTTTGTPTAKHHAYGESPEDLRKAQTDEFVHAVAKAVEEVSAGFANMPLVLCAGPELAGMFRQHYHGGALLEDFIEANPAGLDESDLHERACALVEPAAKAARDEAAERFAALCDDSEGRASTDVSDVVPGAIQGRIDALFIARDACLSGQFDPADQSVSLHPEPARDDRDLSDLAARETLRHGGAVFTPLRREMPAKAAIAAIFRY